MPGDLLTCTCLESHDDPIDHVYDLTQLPCSHTFPAGPNQVLKDLPIGKVRIRLSTLESDRVYTNAYPLLVVTPQGVKKMGELELAVRFSSAAAVNVMHAYLQPQLPRMHFFYPLDPRQLETLRVAAMNIVALRLMRSEPPLRQEIVQFMLDTEAERWSMRRSKANYYRIMVRTFWLLDRYRMFWLIKVFQHVNEWSVDNNSSEMASLSPNTPGNLSGRCGY